jgi:hypothetical protein
VTLPIAVYEPRKDSRHGPFNNLEIAGLQLLGLIFHRLMGEAEGTDRSQPHKGDDADRQPPPGAQPKPAPGADGLIQNHAQENGRYRRDYEKPARTDLRSLFARVVDDLVWHRLGLDSCTRIPPAT